MTDALRSWLLGLTCAALLGSVCQSLTPPGKVKGIVMLCCGALAVMALLAPVTGPDLTQLDLAVAGQYGRQAALTEDLEKVDDALRRGIIEQRCQAYISDKADSCGVTVSSVTVTARWDPAGYWYPARAEIRAEGPEEGIRKLKQALEAELGIPAAEQIWSGDDG